MTRRTGTFASLRVRNYGIYWSVQVVSQLGTWMRLIALSWLVLTDLHGGGTAVGLVAAAQFAPTLVLGPWAGVLADRRSPLAILRVTQVLMAAVDGVLAILVITGAIDLWMVFVATGCGGVVSAFDTPCRQAVVGELVGPDLVPNAIALNSMGFNGARIVGPAIAGALIEVGGSQLCFVVDAASYGVALAGLLALDQSALFARERVARARGQVREGLRYAAGDTLLRSTLVTMAIVGTLSMNFTVLVPILAKHFTSSAGTFGLLSTAMGVGSLAGGVLVARRTVPSLNQLAAASLALCIGMVGVAVAPGFAFAAVALAFTGTCVMTFLSTTNSLLQIHSRPDMRGRVLALYVVLVVGTSPVGSPVVGWIAENHGIRSSLLLGATGAFLGAVVARLPATAKAPQPAAEASAA